MVTLTCRWWLAVGSLATAVAFKVSAWIKHVSLRLLRKGAVRLVCCACLQRVLHKLYRHANLLLHLPDVPD